MAGADLSAQGNTSERSCQAHRWASERLWPFTFNRRTRIRSTTEALHRPPAQRMCIPEIARETTSCWISAVPSKMS
jgi:hypothetical protein